MRALGVTIASSVVALLVSASMARAEGQISDVRFGKQPDSERIVLDLSVDPVDAAQTSTADRFVLELRASKPSLALDKEDRLADLKVTLEDSPLGTRVVVEKRNRPVQAFRIVAAPGSGKGDRIVVDVGRAGASLKFPDDVARIPDGAGAPVSEPVAEVKPVQPRVTPPPPPPPVEPTVDAKPSVPDRKGSQESELLEAMNGTREKPRREEKPVGAAPATPPPPPPPPLPSSDEKKTSESTAEKSGDEGAGEDVWVLVRAIEIQGVAGDAPSVQDLNELKLAVSPVRGGFVAPRDNRPVQRLPLRALVGDDRNGRRLSGSVLQLIVETIAAEYTRNEKLGTRVDIRRADLEGLMQQGGDGRLVIRVREMPARGVGSAEP